MIGIIASGYLPQGKIAGQASTTVEGCTAVKQAEAGGWRIVLTAPNNGMADSDIEIDASPSPGSNLAGGIAFGIASVGPGDFEIVAYAAGGVTTDVPYTFEVRRRR